MSVSLGGEAEEALVLNKAKGQEAVGSVSLRKMRETGTNGPGVGAQAREIIEEGQSWPQCVAEMGLEAPDRSHYHWTALGCEMVLVGELIMVKE